MKINKELLEDMADEVHDVWINWMEYFFRQTSISATKRTVILTLDPSDIHRWKRQMRTKYADLSEKEKASDRRIAEKYIKIILKKLEMVK